VHDLLGGPRAAEDRHLHSAGPVCDESAVVAGAEAPEDGSTWEAVKYGKELEAKLAKLPPAERRRALAVGKKLAKASMTKMLNQIAASHREPRRIA
jgi:hypothetical protein